MTTETDLPPKPVFGYTGRYTSGSLMAPINGWMIDGKEVSAHAAAKAFEAYIHVLELKR